jgi:uncharacterized membrane protein YidH (DUF202 family)
MTTLPDRSGLQPERTALAWQRTAVTATVLMVPLIVVSARLGFRAMTVVVAVATTTSGVLVVGVHRRSSQLGRGHDWPASPYVPMLGVAAGTVLAAVVALATAAVLSRG